MTRLMLLLCVLLLAGGSAHALDLDQVRNETTLDHGELGWYCDPAGSLSAADLLIHPERFQALPGSLGRGFTTAACWLRLPLHRRQATANWWFEVPPPYLDDVQLYLFGADGSVQTRHTGDRQPFSSRDASFGSFFFHVAVPAGDSTLLLRVRTSSTMLVILKVIPADVFLAGPPGGWLLFGLYLGVIVTALLLSAVNVLLGRERIYLLYLAYLCLQLVVGVAVTGMLATFAPELNPAIPDRLVGIGLGLLITLSMAFFWHLMRLADGYGWLRPCFVLTAITGLLTAVSAAQGSWYVHMAPLMHGCLVLTCTLALVPTYWRLRDGNGEDRMFALSFAAFIIYSWVTVLSLAGITPANERAINLSQIANMVQLIALQVSMVVHIRRVEQEAIVARQRVEQQQRLAEEQEQFLTMITQELRTPLAIIDAASRSLRLQDEGVAREREQRYDRIADAVHRMDLLVRLTLGRARLGDDEGGALERLDLVGLTRQLISQMPAELQGRIHIDNAPPQAPVRAQPGLLQFALINLLDNACKYSPAGTPVVLTISSWPARGEVYWAVSDLGPGVPPEDRQRIFDKYYRAGDRAGKPGLGLGLFIARSLIERYGGRLQYRERPRGACFELCLPLDSGSAA